MRTHANVRLFRNLSQWRVVSAFTGALPPTLEGLGQVAVPGVDLDQLAAVEVVHLHGSAVHHGQRSVAAVGGVPDRPDDGGRAVAAAVAEATVRAGVQRL